ncbi:MAG: hypothetical protein GX895_14660 [Clostridiales bacterium]|uniref:hypothetical protein n=1 Tax=Clostridium sp. N3C TaxID=1776758 RepID=UPI00092DF403|nr:hypothetical protein [Clostridium sp. N3C]NLZ49993.1 hypothetical protein [Clostridiales bacterium]SCN25682.1 hypothetical protein N3C_2433 [Clostridium sp. N3C]
MLVEYDPCILEMIENGTYFNVDTTENADYYIYENTGAVSIEGAFELPEPTTFILDYCNTIKS